MSLPIYQTIMLKTDSLDDLSSVLSLDMNLKHPVVFNLGLLTSDQQREFIGLIENFFVTNAISYKFPYPVYILTEHESTISSLRLVNKIENLPKFFSQKDSRTNVKEAQLISKNKLLQQEVHNGDCHANETELKIFGRIHRQVFFLEEERLFYRSLLTRLEKAKNNG